MVATVSLPQAEPEFHAVWDHWLLDSIVTWDRQPEGNHEIPSLEEASAPSANNSANSTFVSEGLGGRLSEIIGAVNRGTDGADALGGLPIRKRVRELPQQQLASKESLATSARLSVAQYFKHKVPAAAHQDISFDKEERGESQFVSGEESG